MVVEIETAEGIGFCFGVRRAIDLLNRAAETGPIEIANHPLARIRTKGQRITE